MPQKCQTLEPQCFAVRICPLIGLGAFGLRTARSFRTTLTRILVGRRVSLVQVALPITENDSRRWLQRDSDQRKEHGAIVKLQLECGREFMLLDRHSHLHTHSLRSSLPRPEERGQGVPHPHFTEFISYEMRKPLKWPQNGYEAKRSQSTRGP